jgi:hypothetical protein
VSGRTDENFPVDRSAYFVIETQSEPSTTKRSLALLAGVMAAICAGSLALGGIAIYLFRSHRRRNTIR